MAYEVRGTKRTSARRTSYVTHGQTISAPSSWILPMKVSTQSGTFANIHRMRGRANQDGAQHDKRGHQSNRRLVLRYAPFSDPIPCPMLFLSPSLLLVCLRLFSVRLVQCTLC